MESLLCWIGLLGASTRLLEKVIRAKELRKIKVRMHVKQILNVSIFIEEGIIASVSQATRATLILNLVAQVKSSSPMLYVLGSIQKISFLKNCFSIYSLCYIIN
uniref:Uncharacterized protein n=1 Tax=Opuntia streptacantha TaxID=393608 RepID=A0A7C9DF81_OPUST